MFRKYLLASAIALCSSPTWAQNVTCPDRPFGDSSNACANTRFVNGGTSGNVTIHGTLTILPTPNTTNKGLVITQTSPIGGSTTGFNFNQISVLDQGMTITGSGAKDAFGLSNLNAIGTRFNYTLSSGQLRGSAAAALLATGTGMTGSYYGFVGSIYSTGTGGGLWGNIGVAQLGPAATSDFLIGIEGELAIAAGGVALYATALNANSQGPVAGTLLHAALALTVGPDASSAPFKQVIALSANMFGGQPVLATTANIFETDSALTIANVFPFSSVTVTGNFADFKTFGISGATGNAAFGIPITSIGASYNLEVSGTAKGVVGVGVSTNTTTGASFIDLKNSTNASQVVLHANESNRTTVRYGLTLGNYTEMTSFLGNGFIIGTQTNVPIIFGSNNVFSGRVIGNQWALGVNANPIAGPLLSINQNSAAITIAVDATPALHIVGANTALAGLQSDAFGASAQNVWTMRMALGTAAAPTQLVSSAIVSTIQSRALDETGVYRTVVALDTASIAAVTSTDWGGYYRVRTGTAGSAALVERFRVQKGLCLGCTTDPGVGMISINSASFLMRNGTSWSNGAAAAAGTIANAPTAGNPTKWIPVDDNGTTRYIPAW